MPDTSWLYLHICCHYKHKLWFIKQSRTFIQITMLTQTSESGEMSILLQLTQVPATPLILQGQNRSFF